MAKIYRDDIIKKEVTYNGKGEKVKRPKIVSDGQETINPKSLDGLTNKRRAFVREYIKDYNGTQAVIRAGYSKNGAGVMADILLNIIDVRKAIDQYEKDLSTRFINTREKVLKEMSLLAYSDIGDYMTESGDLKVKNWKELPPQITRAIKKIRIMTTSRRLQRSTDEGKAGDEMLEQKVEFELYDKKGALEKMGQELGMFVERKEHTGKDGQPLIPTATKVVLDFGVEEE